MKRSNFLFLVLISLSLTIAVTTSPTQAQAETILLQFKNAQFDPLIETPGFPEAYRLNPAQRAAQETLILQFNGPVLPEWKQTLEMQGALFGPYIPDYGFIIKIAAHKRTILENFHFVRWLGYLEPGYKIAANVNLKDSAFYRITLLPWYSSDGTRAALQSYGEDISFLKNQAAGVLSPEAVIAAAQLPGVLWVEPISLKTFTNDQGGGIIMNGTAAWASGYDGSGIFVGAVDTGLDTGIIPAIHPDFGGGRIFNLSSYPIYNYDLEGCGSPTNLGADDGAADQETGHGTHVMGSIAGDGSMSGGQYKGLAYQAQINFQAMEQQVFWPSGCLVPSGFYPMFPPFLNMPLEEAYAWGVRIHNNSWGGAGYGLYDSDAVDYDSFASQNPNFLMTVAAGNEGIDADNGGAGDGFVDADSLLSPGTAKNVLTIGASESVSNPPGGYSIWTWGSWGIFPANPTNSDYVSSNPMHMAAISSVGPTDDGRIKPDLVAPGTDIISVKSSVASFPYGTGWGAHPSNNNYMYNGGTSMSSALAAGAAALVREYYIETEHLTDPSAALIKATLINTATDIMGYANPAQEAGQPIPNMHEGWGLIDVGAATDGSLRTFFDQPQALQTGQTFTWQFHLNNSLPLKISLVWTDPAGAAAANPALVNNLDLTLTDMGGMTYLGNVFMNGWSAPAGTADTLNNVENIYLQAPPPGVYTLSVTGTNIPVGPQDFALVVQGDISSIMQNRYLPMITTAGAYTLSPDPIQDGGFEKGANSDWWEHEKGLSNIIVNTQPPHTGSYSAVFNGSYANPSFVGQPVMIPQDRTLLHFWYSINSTDPLCGPGGSEIHILVDSQIMDVLPVCTGNNTGWVEYVVDLTPLALFNTAAQTIRFEMVTNGNPNSFFYLDDVSLENAP